VAIEIVPISRAEAERYVEELAEILADSVAGGASVGFIAPFTVADARNWWESLWPAIASGDVILLAARVDSRIVGTVQLHLVTKPNGRHRAEVAKLLVHRSARRLGFARQLMLAVEDCARKLGRTLMVLDTESGSPAESLYASLGYTLAGRIPEYAAVPDGRLTATSIMYRMI
jgi:GNAT superfamily N-acetyltransferase